MKTDIIQIVAVFFASMGFAIMFQIPGDEIVWSALGGMLDWVVCVIVKRAGGDVYEQYFWGALFLGFYAEILARVHKVPTTLYLVVGFIPLIPGTALFLAISKALEQDWAACMEQARLAVLTSLSIVGGIIIALVVTNLICRLIDAGRKK